MRVISFGTPGRFEAHIKQLRDSLDKHGMSHKLEILPPGRNKFDAALRKPRFILERLDDTILWLDADSFVTGPIELPGGDWDVGFLRHWKTNGNPVACCAISFRPTETARKFLEKWAGVCEQYEKKFSGTEHDRMVKVRNVMELNEVELQHCLHRKLIVNYKIRKEHVV